MKYWLITGMCLLLWGCATQRAQSEAEPPLNIILIMTDDQGYGDLGLHGNTQIQTPNLDQLGRESVRFTNFHVGTTCAPTRAGLMSGMHCNRVGAWHTVIGRSFLSTRFRTMGSYLQDAGYQTGIFGKWHLGDNYPYRPQDRGFDKVLIHGGGGVGQTPDYWNNDYFDDTYFEDGEARRYDGYCTDVWFAEAVEFIEASQAKAEPFFCYLSTNAPHGPHLVDSAYIRPYLNQEDIVNPNFYGQITNVDDNIGRLRKKLDEMGLSENTLLIFMTDNGTAGGASFVKGQHLKKGYNAGMRGKKGSEYEGGHRVPLFMRFPDRLKIEEQELNQLTAYTDLLPTLLDILGQQSGKFDGTSLWPLIQQGKQDNLNERILIADTQREEMVAKWKNTSVMQGNWRLVNNAELYDIASDPGQQENIFEANPQKVAELSQAYEAWWADIAADVAQENLIQVGHPAENPVLLTCHDWHTEASPPWHQRHLRTGLQDNGAWHLHVHQDGTYQIRLYRYPPYLNKPFAQSLPAGDAVDGGRPYPEAIGQDWRSARISLNDQILERSESTEGIYFEFMAELKAGDLDLQTWIKNGQAEEQGAYFVELAYLP